MASKTGRKIYATKEWKSLRLEIIKRDRYRCQSCKRRGGMLEVHHKVRITESRHWFDPEGLETLCRSCHLRVSSKENTTDPLADQRREFFDDA